MSPSKFSRISDLATLAGVSAATVSRALAGSELVNSKTRDRIVKLAEAHGYRPNEMARNLRLKRTLAIGVLLPLGHEIGQTFSDPFFITMLGHLADGLTARGYALMLTRVIPTDDGWLDRIVRSGRIDGLIIIGQSNQSAVIEAVGQRYLPMVVWGSNVAGKSYCTVGADNRLGGEMAARHLIARNRRRLMFLGNIHTPEFAERQAGFLNVCRQALDSMLRAFLTSI
ncbi:MAG: LacI family DNA-binding transcriptional regulator [Parasphingorhabdus sp.]|nr:LacI family DNA-binding transcriptional regulator [Parasphingorhabdus sp.]